MTDALYRSQIWHGIALALIAVACLVDLSISPTEQPVVEVEAQLAERVVPAQPTAADLLSLLPAPRPDPFDQLALVGLDGPALREAAIEMGVDLGDVAAFDFAKVDARSIDASERQCLAEAIYYEARNQSLAGQMAVADVVLNRVASKRYPNTICGVVYQGSYRATGCQFSFTCDGSMDKPLERRPMVTAQTLATAMLSGFRLPLTNEATNYHATYVKPYWMHSLDQTAKIGDHIFYNRGENWERYVSLP